MSDLLTAIQKIATQYIPNSTGDKRIGYISRLNEYTGRLLASVLPIQDDEPEATADEALSTDGSVALAQLLAATGHPMTFNEAGESVAIDSAAVAQDATPQQNRELGLLGFWGVGPGRFSGGDHSLRDQYYSGDGTKPIDPDVNAWQAYLASQG